jgi:hypothetical protein
LCDAFACVSYESARLAFTLAPSAFAKQSFEGEDLGDERIEFGGCAAEVRPVDEMNGLAGHDAIVPGSAARASSRRRRAPRSATCAAWPAAIHAWAESIPQA